MITKQVITTTLWPQMRPSMVTITYILVTWVTTMTMVTCILWTALTQLLKTDGCQVSPTELESIFVTHPSIKEVAVVGKPDEISGQLPTAFVVLKDKHRDIDCHEILEFVNCMQCLFDYYFSMS